MQRRTIVISIYFAIAIVIIFLAASFLAPYSSPRVIPVSPLILQSPLITITVVSRSHLPFIRCDGCPTATITPTQRPTIPGTTDTPTPTPTPTETPRPTP